MLQHMQHAVVEVEGYKTSPLTPVQKSMLQHVWVWVGKKKRKKKDLGMCVEG
jgi:hypothetical protein